jgi:hypothetical protein
LIADHLVEVQVLIIPKSLLLHIFSICKQQ